MPSDHTAILHLHELAPAQEWEPVATSLRELPGVDHVICEPWDWLVVVHFDARRTTLAQLVRHLEDRDVRVAGVAERRRRRAEVTVATRIFGPGPETRLPDEELV